MTSHWPSSLSELSVAGNIRIAGLQLCLHYALPYLVVTQLWRLCLVASFPWRLAIGLEFAFYSWLVFVKMPALRAAPHVVDPLRCTPQELWASSMERIFAADALGYSVEKWLSGWFLGSDLPSIGRDNLFEWGAHMFFSSRPSTLSDEQRAILDTLIDDLCARVGLSPPAGYNPNVRSIRYLNEPLLVLHRCLLQYFATSVVPRLAVGTLFRVLLGLRRARCDETGLYFWWRAPCSPNGCTADAPPDLLFFHGLCGFTGYVTFLVKLLLQNPARGAVLVELEDVAMCLNLDRCFTRASVVMTTRFAMARLQTARGGTVRGCVVVGHSLGTCPTTWVIQEPPCPIIAAVLIDPVVVLLELPNVAHSFLYRAPRSIFEWCCFLWTSTEIGIATYFRRRFFWHHGRFDISFPEHTPTLFCLSEHDELVPARTVRMYVAEAMPKAEVTWWDGLGHSYFMMYPRLQADVVEWIEKNR
eukprot:TRINITY_DN16457_c0_g1_i1.p1 TRINITY_DN16457_c0_g1~~TRINITY_DN16457_c0_g1_i1.p1  ORF type:complete len:472 (-),score=13.10 TRINITY_DN16457_c0_g1_i1:99-1514(-)